MNKRIAVQIQLLHWALRKQHVYMYTHMYMYTHIHVPFCIAMEIICSKLMYEMAKNVHTCTYTGGELQRRVLKF